VATVVLRSSHGDAPPPVPLEAPHVAMPAAAPPTPPIDERPAPPPPPPITHAKPALAAPSEASLLGEAWSAIGSGNARHALELAHRDAHLYPAGVMREERAAIEVVALAKLGRTTDAHVAAKQFLVRYPASLHRALVEQTISKESP
jgi:hypothetical protein